MDEQPTKTEKNWIEAEAEQVSQSSFDGETKPALKLVENKVTTITIPTAAPFDKWEDKENHTVKKIVPCQVNGEEFVWWLNVKNPIYSQIVTRGAQCYPEPLVLKVLQTGSAQNTRYTIVED